MDETRLLKFDLTFPGHWISGPDRNWAAQTYHMLSLIQGQFLSAVSVYGMFQPTTRENFAQQSKFVQSLNVVYATTFTSALDSISKLLNVLLKDFNPPQAVQVLILQYTTQFADIKHIRDSAAHIEDRGRALDKHRNPLLTNIIFLGCFSNGTRFEFTGGDGKLHAIEITEATLSSAHSILQQIIDAFEWQ